MHHFHERNAVGKEHTHSLAAAYPERRQSPCNLVYTRVQLRVREPGSVRCNERQTIRGGGSAPWKPEKRRLRRAAAE
jgi:hypothetical protein